MKMARHGEAIRALRRDDGRVHARFSNGVTIRTLRNGDIGTIAAVFERLGTGSRARRFCGAKPRLSERELESLALVGPEHHVLVGFVDGDPVPAALARLVRHGATAEIAFEVADAYQGRGIGTLLAGTLAADARAAGIAKLTATVCGDNPPAQSLLRSLARSLRMTKHGWEREFLVDLGSSG